MWSPSMDGACRVQAGQRDKVNHVLRSPLTQGLQGLPHKQVLRISLEAWRVNVCYLVGGAQGGENVPSRGTAGLG